MASFDFIDVSVRAYEFFFRKAPYLFKVAVPVLFVKLVCFLCAYLMGAEDLSLRMGLIMVPSFFLDALFIAGLVRFIIYDEPIFIWGRLVRPPEQSVDNENGLPTSYAGRFGRSKCLQYSIAIYVLIQLMIWSFSGSAKKYFDSPAIQDRLQEAREARDVQEGGAGASDLPVAEIPPAQEASDVNMLAVVAESVVMMIGILALLWMFRLLWLFIPAAMGVSLRYYMSRIRGLQSSILLFVTWFSCVVPVTISISLFAGMFLSIMPDGSASYIMFEAIFKSLLDFSILTVTGIALTFGIFAMIAKKEGGSRVS